MAQTLYRIGIDLMGSDTSPDQLFPALAVLHKELGDEVVLHPVGTEAVIQALLEELDDPMIVEPLITSDVIEMGDAPLSAIRSKRKASMTVAMRKLAKGELDALVSAGNTGALMASTAMFLDPLPGISRPPLLALLPTSNTPVAVLDVGGLINWHAEQLVQFAALGAAFQRCVGGLDCPRIALLNIGSEGLKGNTETRKAYTLLKERKNSLSTFIGNLEGKEVFQGHADVLVTDGFTGNVFLKASEGVAGFVLEALRAQIPAVGEKELAQPVQDLLQMTDHAEHPGALVCGVEGLVIKCHGAASARGVETAVKGALCYLKMDLVARLRADLNQV